MHLRLYALSQLLHGQLYQLRLQQLLRRDGLLQSLFLSLFLYLRLRHGDLIISLFDYLKYARSSSA